MFQWVVFIVPIMYYYGFQFLKFINFHDRTVILIKSDKPVPVSIAQKF